MKRILVFILLLVLQKSLASLAYNGLQLRFTNSNLLNHNEKVYKSEDLLLISFNRDLSHQEQSELKRYVEVYGYIPSKTYLVEVKTNTSILALTSNDKISSLITQIQDYDFRNKISDQALKPSVFNKDLRQVFYISLYKEKHVRSFKQKFKNVSEKIICEGRFCIIETKMADLINLASYSKVEWIEPYQSIQTLEIRLDDVTERSMTAGDYSDLNGFENGTKVMNFESLWSKGVTGQNQIVSYADTGLDTGDVATLSLDFKNNLYSGFAFAVDGKSWFDPMGHGTHVAGSIVSSGENSNLLRGGAFGAKIIAQSMWSPLLGGLMVPVKLANLFDAAYKQGARIHSNSWGKNAGYGVYDSFSQQVDEFMFNNQDFLLLFAAGNEGADKDSNGKIDEGSLLSPATAKNVLTVGASENLTKLGGIQKQIKDLKSAKGKWEADPIASSYVSDNENGVAMFSSRGPTADKRRKPDIVSPGTNILSTRSHVPGASPLWGEYNKDYVWAGGTSMATPLTAGAAVLVRQYLIEKKGLSSPYASLIKGSLMFFAKDMYPGQYGDGDLRELEHAPDNNQGFGRTDLHKFSEAADSAVFIDDLGLATNETKEFKIQMLKGQSLKAMLIYTDAPSLPSVQKNLVNDLSLTVIVDGNVSLVNNTINNYEIMGPITASADEEVRLVVKGESVPIGLNGKQPFSLIYKVE